MGRVPLPRATTRMLLCGVVTAALVVTAQTASPSAPAADRRPSAPTTASPSTEPPARLAADDLASAPAARVRAPKAGYGFAGGAGLLGLGRRALEREVGAVARTGATWLRVPVIWAQVEQRPGRFQWGTVDRIVRTARRHDLKVLANVSYAPAWARAFLSSPTAPPADPATYAAFCARLAQRYRTQVRHWEIWNEPNLSSFFGGVRTHSSAPERYTALLSPAYRAIHRAQPRAVVVAGALSAATTRSLVSYSMGDFVTRMYRAGARGHFDALALHPYVGSGDDATRRRVYRDVRRVRSLMVDRRDGRKQVWWTELGHSTWTGGVSPQRQKTLVLEQLRAAARRSYVGPTFVFAIRDTGSNRADLGQNFGALLTHDFRPKPLAAALRQRGSSRSPAARAAAR